MYRAHAPRPSPPFPYTTLFRSVIGVNPAGDGMSAFVQLWTMLDELIRRFEIPTQSCVLTHVTNQIAAIEQGAPVDLVFQSRSEEHTSELQSHHDLVCRLLLEKK